jgi:hypothetical protein
MDSWWNLGEWYGYDGTDLALYKITCPFCSERGNFSKEFGAEKKQPNGRRVIHFDTFKCGSCASFVQVVWSAAERLHDFRVQPWPLKVEKAPDHWPEPVGRYWLQAKRSLLSENWDAAAVMARSALQVALRGQKATGRNLREEIDSLAALGVLPKILQEWAHEVRELGNESAHPTPEQQPTSARDAKDIVQFLDYFLEYSYTLPKKIQEFRKRKE